MRRTDSLCERRELTWKRNRTTFPKRPFGGPGPVAGLGTITVQENKRNSTKGENESMSGRHFRPSALERHLRIFTHSYVTRPGPERDHPPDTRAGLVSALSPPRTAWPETRFLTPSGGLFTADHMRILASATSRPTFAPIGLRQGPATDFRGC
jgi:hypothetical protein